MPSTGWPERPTSRTPGHTLTPTIPHVLFVCLHNAGRSQIGEAMFERAAAGKHAAPLAGTRPAQSVHPDVVEAMAELGVELGERRHRRLERSDAERSNVVVTMGCGDECP